MNREEKSLRAVYRGEHPSSSKSSAPSSELVLLFSEEFFSMLAEIFPSRRKHLVEIGHIVGKVLVTAKSILLYASKYTCHFTASHMKMVQYNLEYVLPMLLGLTICFVGGHYPMLITVFETVRMLCWKDLKASFVVLRHNYEVAMEQNRKDDLIDADGNGIPDVQEMDQRSLVRQKIKILIKSMDWEQVNLSIRTLVAAYLSVIAALQVRLARSLTLAGSVVNTLQKCLPLDNFIDKNVSPESRKLVHVLVQVMLHVICVPLAILMSGLIGMVTCAIRGSHMFVRNGIVLGHERGLLKDDVSMTNMKTKILMLVVATTGVLWQITTRNGFPFPLNIFLFPLTCVEWILQVFASRLLFVFPRANFT